MRALNLIFAFAAATIVVSGTACAADLNQCVSSSAEFTTLLKSEGQQRLIIATQNVILPKVEETGIIITGNLDPNTDRPGNLWQVEDAHSSISPTNQLCARETFKPIQITFNRRPPSVITNNFNEADADRKCDKAVAAGLVDKDGCGYLGNILPHISAAGERILLWGTTPENIIKIVEGNVDNAGMPAGDPAGFGGILNTSASGSAILNRILRNIQITEEFRQILRNRALKIAPAHASP